LKLTQWRRDMILSPEQRWEVKYCADLEEAPMNRVDISPALDWKEYLVRRLCTSRFQSLSLLLSGSSARPEL
jgi:hypothetical protein